MPDRPKLLQPASKNPPAKIKDPGVVALAMAGGAAYNAKTGELLLLPIGEALRAALVASLREALFQCAQIQQVNCGNDDALFSLADRYAREWGDAATAYAEERGRDLYILAWHSNLEEAAQFAERSARAVLSAAGTEAGLSVTHEISLDPIHSLDAIHSTVFVSHVSAPSLNMRDGFVCDACGKIYLPESPISFDERQPGADEPEESPEEIETPGANTIAELCAQLDLDIRYTIKAMLYIAHDETGEPRPVAAFTRGDRSVSLTKLALWLRETYRLTGLRSAEKPELERLVGEVAGYCGPVGLPGQVVVVCDESVRGAKNIVAGANRPGYHIKGCCHGRDFDHACTDISLVTEGVRCACGGTLKATALRVCGKVENLPAMQTEVRPLNFRDRDGMHNYPVVTRGRISGEMLLLARHS